VEVPVCLEAREMYYVVVLRVYEFPMKVFLRAATISSLENVAVISTIYFAD